MHAALQKIDLNLLLVFDALYRGGSVALAARELGMSASACSHALARLREGLADELFVRYGSAMQPTALSEEIADDIGLSLRRLSDSLGRTGKFDPASSTELFRIAATDYTAFAVLPALSARLAVAAPRLRLEVMNTSHHGVLTELTEGRVQFALGFADENLQAYDGVDAMDAFADEYAVLARTGHPRIQGPLTLDGYLAERHVVVRPWTDVSSVIDNTLAKSGLTRDVAVQLPSIMVAPYIVAQTDYLLSVPQRVARQLAAATGTSVHTAPFPTPRYTLQAYFHVRYAGGPAHRWMQQQLQATLNTL